MNSALASIQEKAQQLPLEKQLEVVKFIETLLSEAPSQQTRGLKFDWCDGPDDPPVMLSSVELQHEALEWRVKKAEEYLQQP
ncbi:MAG: DUF2281 domain-containing protein [Blastocatellales bacterium]